MRGWGRSPNKFKNERVHFAGQSFASKGEASCYQELVLREKAKEIEILGSQVTVYLTLARIAYIADFKYLDLKTKQEIHAEFKGFETPEWRIKRRLWLHYGPTPLEVYKKNHRGIFLSETLVPKKGRGEENERSETSGTEPEEKEIL